jgi:hypothetical protein
VILATLMMEGILSSETSVLTRVTRRNIREDGKLRYSYIYAAEQLKLPELRKRGSIWMFCSFFKFTLIPCSIFLFRKLVVSEFLLDLAEV